LFGDPPMVQDISLRNALDVFFGPLEDYEFLDYRNALGTLGTLPCKQSDVAERLPRQIIFIN